MAISRKIATASVAAAALATTVFGAAQATADPIAGGCSGGQFDFTTTPLSMTSAPITATWSGNLSSCTGTPAPTATVNGTFNGTGGCLGATGNIDGSINWSNGQISRIRGPWHVPSGMATANTNTVVIVDGPGTGGQMVIDDGGIINASALTGPCLSGDVRAASLRITEVRFS
ncbi:hypothetical protein ACQP0C_38100 [Nocardia sp. CA-129566]|uniref:hypothetical protein n=1 Tax=Nocardia sp. CA-129566 TaxID=3239976 RepID=UPI003D95482B